MSAAGAVEGSADAPVDVLVIGAGVTGLYQLWRALDAGFTAALLEAGDGVGGVWHWNRYPGARVDTQVPIYEYSIEKIWKVSNSHATCGSDRC